MLATLQRLRLVHLLLLMCAPPLLALVLSVLLGLLGMKSTHRAATEVTQQTLPALQAAMQVAALLQSDASLVLRASAAYDEKDRDGMLARQAGNAQQVDAALARLKASPEPKVQAALKALAAARQDYAGAVQMAIDQLKNGDADGSRTMIVTDALPKLEPAKQALDQLIQAEVALADARAADVDGAYTRSFWMLLGLVLVGALASLMLMGLGLRTVIGQLGGEPRRATAAAVAIADGDLSEPITTRRARPGSLMEAMERMRLQLGQLVSDVRNGVDSLTTASAEIAAGNMDLSSRTEQQAGALQVTASSMEELTATVGHSAEHARSASQLAGAAASAAALGGQTVQGVVHTMERITQPARARSPTSFRSSTASPSRPTSWRSMRRWRRRAPASRAVGFAVVAGEVRLLAQRSAEAAKEIKTLIADSVEKVEEGNRQVAGAGSTMQEVVGSVQKVADLIQEISHAADEQSSGIAQVNGSIGDMDHSTQQNAALVEQMAAAAQSLKNQAQALAQAVAVFRV
jgi:methyl-accepting chemotaxis protein